MIEHGNGQRAGEGLLDCTTSKPLGCGAGKIAGWDPAFIVRKVAVDKTRSSLEKALASIKQKLESQAQ